MIAGHNFTNKEIASEEKKNLDAFYNSDNPLLAEGISYYAVLFENYLTQNADKYFKQLPAERQSAILEKEMSRFQTAMVYSFNKGHQTAFAVLLMESGGKHPYDEEFFRQADAKQTFMFAFDDMVSEDVFENNISRDANDVLINYTRRFFENGYKEVMLFGKIFFKKGAGLAFEQIRRNIVGVEPDIKGYSRMLNIPLNQDFAVTPAFSATFAMESPNFEEWELHWDDTYDVKYSDSLLAKILIHGLTVSQIKSYADAEAGAYQTLEHYMVKNFPDDETVYFAEFNFALINPETTSRFIQKDEFSAIRDSLATTICRQLNVSANHIFIMS